MILLGTSERARSAVNKLACSYKGRITSKYLNDISPWIHLRYDELCMSLNIYTEQSDYEVRHYVPIRHILQNVR